MTNFNLEIIKQQNKEVIDARKIHKELGIKTHFSKWFNQREIDVNLIPNKHYITFVKIEDPPKTSNEGSSILNTLKTEGFRPLNTNQKEYGLSQAGAMRILMFEKGSIPNQMRDYIEDLFENRNTQHLIPQTLSDALLLAGNLAKEKEIALLQVETKQALIDQQKPLVDYAEVVKANEKDVTINEFANKRLIYTALGQKLGGGLVRRLLKNTKVINEYNIPFTKYAPLFRVTLVTKNDRTYEVTLVRGDQVQKLYEIIMKYITKRPELIVTMK